MRWVFLPLILVLSFQLASQTFSRVQVFLSSEHNIQRLTLLGLDLDHGHLQPEKYFISEFSENEIDRIVAAGFKIKVLVNDLKRDLIKKNLGGFENRTQPYCVDFKDTNQLKTPYQYTYGSMAGFHTYSELLSVLDTMAARYPGIFKKRQPVNDTLLTHEGRQVYFVKISDNPEADEDEPAALFTALQHAREPVSLSQMLFFMWHLLEQYHKNPEINYLINNTQLYFIPCVNPDGYIYNEITNPEGGGFWRKNRRNNQDGSAGVDINRNYGYKWAFNESGSSSSPESQTYRGHQPDSEPETRLIQYFCKKYKFLIALNFHSFGNAVLYPWGYSDSITIDQPIFRAYSESFVHNNSYDFGLSTRTLGYPANGTSDDWMYGDTLSKPKIYAFTPEIGPSSLGFWPAKTEIDELNKEAFLMNLNTVRFLLNYAELRHSEGPFIEKREGSIGFLLRKLGLTPGELTVSLNSPNNALENFPPIKTFNLNTLEESVSDIQYSLKPEIRTGDTILFELKLSNGFYTWIFPISKVYSPLVKTTFKETGEHVEQWQVFGNWGTSNKHFYSPPSSITDSPSDNYSPNSLSELTSAKHIIVKNAKSAILSFWAKWDIEEDEDYAMVLLSVNDGPFKPLCGKYTENGTYAQVADQPVYDGFQASWIKEQIDLTEFLTSDSTNLKIIFRIKTDEAVEKDGFYFDDLIVTLLPKDSLTHALDSPQKELEIRVFPNPSVDIINMDLGQVAGDCNDCIVRVFDLLGNIVMERPVNRQKLLQFRVSELKNGMYFIWLKSTNKVYPCSRVIVNR
jgi:hypothetical protein